MVITAIGNVASRVLLDIIMETVGFYNPEKRIVLRAIRTVIARRWKAVHFSYPHIFGLLAIVFSLMFKHIFAWYGQVLFRSMDDMV